MRYKRRGCSKLDLNSVDPNQALKKKLEKVTVPTNLDP